MHNRIDHKLDEHRPHQPPRRRAGSAGDPAPTGPRVIVAQVGEGGTGREVREAAIALADQSHARLVLFDADSAGVLSDPMPSNWSSDGADDEFGDLLSPADLDVLGRPELRDMVAAARERGLDAHGCLAGARGVDSITAYAERIGADVVLVPDEPAVPDALDLLEKEVLRAARDLPSSVRVGVVADDGSIRYEDDGEE